MNNKRTVILGKSGSGKSRLARYIVNRFPGKVLIVDPKRSFLPLPTIRFGPSIVRQGLNLRRLLADNQKVVLKPENFLPEQAPELLEMLAPRVREFPGILFVVDEAHIFMPRWLKRDEGPQSKLLWSDGRHEMINLLYITQMPVELHVWPLKQANTRITFLASFEAEAKYLGGFFQVDHRVIQNLQEWSFLYTNDRGKRRIYKPSYLPSKGG